MELLYNPDSMTEEEIKATFVAREGLLDDFISLIKRQREGAGVQHLLIIAPRGMGKTTMLLMTKFAVKDRSLAKTWQAIKFPEESYGIYDLADFWVETLLLIAAETEDDELRERAEKLKEKYPDSDELQEIALAAVKDWARKHKKRLLLLVDNFDIILEQINDERDAARLRDVLMNDGTMMLIGGAVSHFHEISDYEEPLYNFFKIQNLAELTFEQTHELLIKLAKMDNRKDFEALLKANAPRLRTLEYFTGGNTRLVIMLYRVVARSDVSEVKRALEKLLDDVTPYFKAKVESLTPQPRKILDYIARISSKTNEGVTPNAIAQAVRLAPNQVSAQLKRLTESGYTRAANVRGRSSYYTLSEPLYSIWHQMRFGRDAREKMQWLVDFLKRWYSHDEIETEHGRLESRFRKRLGEGRADAARDALEHLRYLSYAMEGATTKSKARESVILGHLELKDNERLKKELLREIKPETLSKQTRRLLYEAGCITKKELNQTKTSGGTSEKARQKAEAHALFRLGYKVFQQGKSQEALKHFDEALKHLHHEPGLWYLRGEALFDLEKYSEAIISFDRSINLNPDSHNVWHTRGSALNNLSTYEEALPSLERAIELDPICEGAWAARGIALTNLDKDEEALQSFNHALEITKDIYETWFERSKVLLYLNKYEESIESSRQALKINSKAYEVWGIQGFALLHLKMYEEAINSFDRALKINSNDWEAWYGRGFALSHLDKYQEALISFDKVIKLNPNHHMAWHKRGVALDNLNRQEEAIGSYDKALAIEPKDYGAWEHRANSYFFNFLKLVSESKFNLAKNSWYEALSSAKKIDSQKWQDMASEVLQEVAQGGHFDFVKQLIQESDLKELLFPLVRALDYLIEGDEALIERLSPEVRGIVEEVIAKLKEGAPESTTETQTGKKNGLGKKTRQRRMKPRSTVRRKKRLA